MARRQRPRHARRRARSARSTTASGVVGVAPGVRLWAVKILNDTGEGLLSWYVCGLDWIAAQRDPNDPTRPLFEAVNMSVAKWGKRRRQLRPHRTRTSSTRRSAASSRAASRSSRRRPTTPPAPPPACPAAYNEVITVSALADTDGKPGGLGGHRCFSWGTYDVDDTFADFSNYGSDVDLIAPGKCIWSTIPGGYDYMSGTSMAAPHVTGAVALLKASRPGLTPAEVREALQYLGNVQLEDARRTRTRTHEKLLDVSPHRAARRLLGRRRARRPPSARPAAAARFPITITRTPTSFERVRLSVSDLPSGWAATFDAPERLRVRGCRVDPHAHDPGRASPRGRTR